MNIYLYLEGKIQKRKVKRAAKRKANNAATKSSLPATDNASADTTNLIDNSITEANKNTTNAQTNIQNTPTPVLENSIESGTGVQTNSTDISSELNKTEGSNVADTLKDKTGKTLDDGKKQLNEITDNTEDPKAKKMWVRITELYDKAVKELKIAFKENVSYKGIGLIALAGIVLIVIGFIVNAYLEYQNFDDLDGQLGSISKIFSVIGAGIFNWMVGLGILLVAFVYFYKKENK